MNLTRFGGKRRALLEQRATDGPGRCGGLARSVPEARKSQSDLRRNIAGGGLAPQQSQESEGLDAQMGKLRRGIARLIDSYAEGFIDKQECEPGVTRMRERLHHLEEQLQRLKEEAEGEEVLRAILGRLETFATKVNEGLHDAGFQTRREIIRALVKRVEIDEQQIRVVFRISPLASAPPFDGASPNWQHWGRRVLAPSLQSSRKRGSYHVTTQVPGLSHSHKPSNKK